MNNYFTLRKANRLRVKLLTEKSRRQIKEVVRYLRRVSWDVCGVELVYSDLIDIAVRANEEGQELFSVISDAKTFVDEVKPGLKRLSWFDFFTIEIPVFLFFGYGVEGLFLYPLLLSIIPDYGFDISLGYLIQVCVCMASSYELFRRMMEKVGFPPCAHRLKYAGYLVLYVAVLYGIGSMLYQLFGQILFVRIPVWPMTIGSLLLGAFLLWLRYDWYGRDVRLLGRI